MRKTLLFGKFTFCFFVMLVIPLLGCAATTNQFFTVTAQAQAWNFPFEASIFYPIRVEPTTTFEVKLPANATTGYQWKIEGLYDPRLVQLVSEDYLAPASNLVGAGGAQVFVFKSLENTGFASLSFAYYRVWEGVQDDTQFFTVHVYVKKK